MISFPSIVHGASGLMIILSVFNGPFGPYGHGSFLPIAETTSRYFMSLLTKMSEERISALAPSQAAVDDFARHRRAFMPKTAWTAPCRSWFKQVSRLDLIE